MRFGFTNEETKELVRFWDLNPSQEKFWNSQKKFVLFSGGYGCGKSLMLVLKAIELAIRYDNNYILMGRKTYPELRDTLWKEFINICPENFIKGEPLRAEMKIKFVNGSEIIFRHLDKMSESEIRSLNLGAAFIDQAEDISKEVFHGLRGRLRRDGIPEGERKIYLSCNPALSWLYAEFKQNPKPEYEVIEASTMENERNLPKEYIEDLMKYPEAYKRQFVYGIWDINLLSERAVFAREHITKLESYARDPIETIEGLDVYKKFVPGHRYQMGVDSGEGSQEGDYSTLTIADMDTLEEVASYGERIPPDILAEKVGFFARMYQDERSRCLIVPEMNSIGLALVSKLKQDPELSIYQREEFDKVANRRLMKIGWRMTRQSKPLLISHFQELLRMKDPHVYSFKTIAEIKSFIYTDVAKKQGMGAEVGFHDDRLISLLLAFWEKGKVIEGFIPLLSLQDLERSTTDEFYLYGERRLSVVVAGGGREKTVIVLGGENGAEVVYESDSGDTMKTVDEIIHNAERFRVDVQNIFVDKIGVSKGVCDRLNDSGWRVNGVAFGSIPEERDSDGYGKYLDGDTFYNLRSQCYWRMAEKIKAGFQLRSHKDWSALLEIRYKIQSDRKVNVMGRDDMQKWGIESPDTGDALAMLFARRKKVEVQEELSDSEVAKLTNVY